MSPLQLGEIPQVNVLRHQLRKLWTVRRVLVLASDQRVICCWNEGSDWRLASGTWPDDCCFKGQPLHQDAMGELLADLLLDADVVGAQIELVLPLEGCEWRVLEGVHGDQALTMGQSQAWLGALDWSLKWPDCYVALTSCADDLLAIGVDRTLFQAWVDVVEIADQPLRRVDWMLSSALRGLMLHLTTWQGDLAWVLADQQGLRLVVIRDGVPEIDYAIPRGTPSIMRQELRRVVSAWQSLAGSTPSMGWWLSLPDELVDSVAPIVDIDRGEQRLDMPVQTVLASDSDQDELDSLNPLEQLALEGMFEDIYS